MIALLSGVVASISLYGEAVIDVNGVGYKVALPENEVNTIRNNDIVTLHISTHVREDAITLYGFSEVNARDLFDKLTSVSGIGGKIALAMISVLTPQGIINALDTSDVDMLCTVPGIGKKTAQRMIVELSNVAGIKDLFIESSVNTNTKDVCIALEELGYSRQEISNVIKEINPDLDIDVMIKESLKMLSSQKVNSNA